MATVSLARADYIAFLDHDDLFEPDKLARQAAQLDSRPELGLVFTQARTVGGGTEEIFPQIADPDPFLASAYENLVHWNYIPMSSVMARRPALRATTGARGEGPFDPRFALAEDWDLWLRLAADHAVGFIPEPLVRYVIRQGRATERMADLRLPWRPSAGLLASTWPVDALRDYALGGDEGPAPALHGGQVRLLIRRTADGVAARRLGSEEYTLLDRLGSGLSLAEVLDGLAAEPAPILARAIVDGVFSPPLAKP